MRQAPSAKFPNLYSASNVNSELRCDSLLPPLRIVLVGTFAPRQCGIATFCGDIVAQLRVHHPEISTDVYAVDRTTSDLVYQGVKRVIRIDSSKSWAASARAINHSDTDAVWLQHEFGIFGSDDGEAVCAFVEALEKPVVTTLHTVLGARSSRQRRIMQRLVAASARMMVMSRHGKDALVEKYGAAPTGIEVIEHGAPDRPFGRGSAAKAALRLSGRNVLMTFGLIGPGKGLERMIEAMPDILIRHPDTIYRIVGATHPNLLKEQGETYRDGLKDLAVQLGCPVTCTGTTVFSRLLSCWTN